jgi:hypothetical protein
MLLLTIARSFNALRFFQDDEGGRGCCSQNSPFPVLCVLASLREATTYAAIGSRMAKNLRRAG